jgi:hypothetical protein
MVTFSEIQFIVLQLSLLLRLGNGFGPRLEPLHNRAGAYISHGGFLVVLQASNSSSEDDERGTSRELGLYDFPPAAFESVEDFALTYQEGFDGTFTFLQEHADILALETFEDSLDFDDFCGEDCNECEIPEDWNILSGPVAAVDVMAFLGISRAKPLTLPLLSIRAWE